MAYVNVKSMRLSLLAVSSKLNITAHNQGDNCIVARSSGKLICSPNQSQADEDKCSNDFDYNNYPKIVNAVEWWLKSLPNETDVKQYEQKEVECNHFNLLLKDCKDLQAIKQTLLQGEAQRLRKKLGADHWRVLQMETRLKQNLSIVQDLEVRVELAKIHVPEVQKNDALLHGRVTDKSYRGIRGLRVFIEGEKGDEFGSLVGETDDSGYYAIQIDSETKDKLGKIYLTVSTKKGTIIHKEQEVLKLESDSPLIAKNVSLDLSILSAMK